MIRAVCFDVDDTLVDFDRAARLSFGQLFGADADYADWVALDHFRRYERGELDFRAMRELRMADFLPLVGRAGDVPRAADLEAERFAALAVHYALFDDVRPCLAALRAANLQLGLITNNESDHQRAKIAAVGLAPLVDVVAISGEVGVAKPDPEIFRWTCRELGAVPEAVVHVGDRLDVDARAAAAAGLRGVWLDRAGRGTGDEGIPVIRGLRELPALVRAGAVDAGAAEPVR